MNFRSSTPAVLVAALGFLTTTAASQQTKQPLDGQIVVDPENPRWLKRHGGDPFFLCALGDPEGFLYRGKRNPDGTRDGDQMSTIRKIAQHGGNGLYMIAVRTHGGDAWKDKRDSPDVWPDDLHNPWSDQDPRKGFNEEILAQWETWFAEMDRRGIVIYLFIYDDAINLAKRFGWALDSQGRLHPEEKSFIQALVRRFQHHRNLVWCVMEEGQEIGADWKRHVSAIAEAIREADDHGHVIAAHQLGGNVFFHAGDPNIDQFALQTHAPSVKTKQEFHNWLVQAWELADGRYSLNMSEDLLHGQMSQAADRTGVRQRNWAAAMAGAYVMVLGMDGANTPPDWLADCRRLQLFFEGTDFYNMAPADALAAADTEYVMAAPEGSYILYSSHAISSLGLKGARAGSYELRWLDIVSGKTIDQRGVKLAGGDQAFRKPDSLGNEVALYLRHQGAGSIAPAPRQSSSNTRISPTVSRPNRPPVVENTTIRASAGAAVEIQLTYTDPDGGPGPYAISILSRPRNGILSGTGNDLVFTPNAAFRGTDRLRWKVHDGAGESDVGEVQIIIAPPK
jgi:hypothetical protein